MYAGLIGDEDIDLFRPTAGRRRRQTHQAPILNADLLNYTAEHIALCGDDSACLFDFAVTGERDFAVTTIESGKNFTKTVETLSMHSYNSYWYCSHFYYFLQKTFHHS